MPLAQDKEQVAFLSLQQLWRFRRRPILKKKLFFFFNFDKIIQHGGAINGFGTVPTAAMLNGDFTGQATIYDPAHDARSVGDAAALAREPLLRMSMGTATKFLPAGSILLAKAIQAYYPRPNTPGNMANGVTTNNFFYNVPNSQPFTKFFGRLDYDIRSNNRLTLSETESDNPAYSNGQGHCPINCQSQDVSRHNAQITDVWTISPNIINEARIGYTNQLNFFVPASLGKGFPGKLGWQFAKADIFPNISVNGGYYTLDLGNQCGLQGTCV